MGLPAAEGWFFLLRRHMEFEEQFLFTPRRKTCRYPLDRRLDVVANAPAEIRTPVVNPVRCHTELFLLLDLMFRSRSPHDVCRHRGAAEGGKLQPIRNLVIEGYG